MSYSSFVSLHPDYGYRVGALLSLASPDPKPISLWALTPGELYDEDEIFNNTLSFSGMSYKDFPLTGLGLAGYYHGHTSRKIPGTLESIGAIDRGDFKSPGTFKMERYKFYKKTGLGEDFGDPIAAASTWFVNELIEKNLEGHKSTQQIIGMKKVGMDTKYNYAYATYKVIELLAKNTENGFSLMDIHDEIGDIITIAGLSTRVNKLSGSKMLDYKSDRRDVNGKITKGYSRYTANEKIDYDEAVEKAKIQFNSFYHYKILERAINFAKKNIGEYFSIHDLSRGTCMKVSSIRKGLDYLIKMDYLQHEFGKKSWTYAKANDSTVILWEGFLEPIGRAARNMNPKITGLQEKLDIYNDKKKRIHDIRNRMAVYETEKSRIGPVGGKVIRKFILEVLDESEDMVKLSVITKNVGDKLGRRMDRGIFSIHLGNMKREGIVYSRNHCYGLVDRDIKSMF